MFRIEYEAVELTAAEIEKGIDQLPVSICDGEYFESAENAAAEFERIIGRIMTIHARIDSRPDSLELAWDFEDKRESVIFSTTDSFAVTYGTLSLINEG